MTARSPRTPGRPHCIRGHALAPDNYDTGHGCQCKRCRSERDVRVRKEIREAQTAFGAMPCLEKCRCFDCDKLRYRAMRAARDAKKTTGRERPPEVKGRSSDHLALTRGLPPNQTYASPSRGAGPAISSRKDVNGIW